MDIEVIETRLQKLDTYVRHLRQLQQVPLDEYLADDNMQAIVERRLQLAIQACIDIAGYLIAQLGLEAPDSAENVFAVLGREGILPQGLAQRMLSMVRFRNILVHDYLEIDSKIVHSRLTDELEDFDQFAQAITGQLPIPDADDS